MTITQLKVFLAIFEKGSVSNASVLLEMSQPATTKALQSLEQDLGATLFKRSRAGAIPTEEGLRFYEKALRIVTDYDRIKRQLQGIDISDNRIIFGIDYSLKNLLFSHVLPRLLTADNPYTYFAQEGYIETFLEYLLYHKLDFYCGNLRYIENVPSLRAQFNLIEMGSIRYHILCRPDHPLTQQDSKLSLADCYQWRLVSYATGRDLFNKYQNYEGVQGEIPLQVFTNSADGLMQLLLNTDLIASVPEFELASASLYGLVPVMTLPDTYSLRVGIGHLKGVPLSEGAEQIVNTLQAVYAEVMATKQA